VSLTDRDNGAKALAERIRKLAKPVTLTVGVHEGAPAIDHASFVEFGTATHPPESFLRAWADATTDEQRAALRQVAADALTGTRPLEEGLTALGERWAADVRSRAPEGRGVLRESITAEVSR
jgi:hypothetical protein